MSFGWVGELGLYGICDQGLTYAGARYAACGGGVYKWGATEMEVWYRTGP